MFESLERAQSQAWFVIIAAGTSSTHLNILRLERRQCQSHIDTYTV